MPMSGQNTEEIFSRAVKWMQGDVIRYRLDAGGVVYEYEFTPI